LPYHSRKTVLFAAAYLIMTAELSRCVCLSVCLSHTWCWCFRNSDGYCSLHACIFHDRPTLLSLHFAAP